MRSSRKTIEQTAAGWHARRDAGLSPAEAAEFACWLEADDRHRRAFRGIELTWSQLDRVRGTELAAALEIELDAPPRVAPLAFFPLRLRPLWVSAALAAAAIVTIGYPGWWRPARAEFTQVAAAAIGDVRTLNLPDGSAIRLNTDSEIRVQFKRAERRIVLLRGEGLFTVAKDTERPFVVIAGGVAVQAVGTAFNVRLRPNDVQVIVTKGVVRVHDAVKGVSLLARPASEAAPIPAGTELLSMGETVVIPVLAATAGAPTLVVPVIASPIEIERVRAWPERRLLFVSTPLAEIVAEFNRYNHRKLVIASADLAARRFGGTFQATDPETLVQLLGKSFGVTSEVRGGEILLRSTHSVQKVP